MSSWCQISRLGKPIEAYDSRRRHEVFGYSYTFCDVSAILYGGSEFPSRVAKTIQALIANLRKSAISQGKGY